MNKMDKMDMVVENKEDIIDIKLEKLNFSYTLPDYTKKQVLHDIDLKVKRGSRCLLIGANGASKTTLLRVIAGKHLVEEDTAIVLGEQAFYQTDGLGGLTYLGHSWTKSVAFVGNSVPYQADIPVKDLRRKVQEEFKERRDQLYELLEIDPEWRLHLISDGQRRRVQIMLGLLRPFKVLLCDELTVDLDLLARKRFLEFLIEESKDATIIYCTHIFDGLSELGFPTHLIYMDSGRVLDMVEYEQAIQKKSLYFHINDFLLEMEKKRKERALKQVKDNTYSIEKNNQTVNLYFSDGFGAGRMNAYR